MATDYIGRIKALSEQGLTRGQRLRHAYTAVFGTIVGRAVLADLARRCSAASSTYDDHPSKMAFREGQRAVFLHIQTMIHMDEERLRQLLGEEVDHDE